MENRPSDCNRIPTIQTHRNHIHRHQRILQLHRTHRHLQLQSRQIRLRPRHRRTNTPKRNRQRTQFHTPQRHLPRRLHKQRRPVQQRLRRIHLPRRFMPLHKPNHSQRLPRQTKRNHPNTTNQRSLVFISRLLRRTTLL